MMKIVGSLPREASRKLAQAYGPKNLEKVLSRDLYKAVRDAGCAIDIADRLATALRLDAATKVLGHVEWALISRSTMSRAMLISKMQFALELSRATVARVLDSVIASGKLVAVESDKIVTRRHYAANVRIGEDIRRRSRAIEHPLPFGDAEGLEGLQLEALKTVAKHRVSIITGPPGTGKSYVVRKMLASSRIRSRVTAPTGRAARNALGRTIHHFKMIQESGKEDFRGVELVIVDEASMLSVDLFAMVLDLVSEDAHIVLVGDVDQLPPIDAGDVFRDLIDSGVVPVTVLEVNRRCEDTDLNAFSRGLRDGVVLDFPDSVTLHICETKAEIRAKVPPLVVEHRAIVLTPHNATRIELNGACQQALGLATLGSLQTGEGCVCVGDRIVITKNSQCGRACNGDLGLFHGKKDEDEYYVEVDSKQLALPRASKNDAGLTLGYAITVHKAQGSEFDTVVLPVHDTHAWDRTLLYTAVTRAKARVHLLGTREDIEAIVRTTRAPRPSLLRTFL